MRNLHDLSETIDRHSIGMDSPTVIPRMSLVTGDETHRSSDTLYRPMVCFVANGRKKITLDRRVLWTGPGTVMVSSLEIPVTYTIAGGWYKAVILDLNDDAIVELLTEMTRSSARSTDVDAGIFTSEMSSDLIDSVTRLVELLDRPEDISVLAPRTEAEVFYRLLQTPVGPILRQLALADSRAARVRDAAHWIHDHAYEPIDVSSVADVAHMSQASLYRHFKSATGLTPIQFQKRIRLHDARRLLFSGATSVAGAAAKVGYLSTSQFSRDYFSAYGVRPGRDSTHQHSIEHPEP